MLVNLTPHELNIVFDENTTFFIPSQGVARMKEVVVPAGEAHGVPLIRSEYGGVVGLPDPQVGVVYITSMLVASHVKRPDVVSPGELQRDANGRVIGCKSLKTYV